jgi:hypothetical protein
MGMPPGVTFPRGAGIEIMAGIEIATGAFSGCADARGERPMNDNKPDKPAWLMRDKATMATIQALRRQGITTAAKGDRWHAMQVQRTITMGTTRAPNASHK